MEAPSNSSEIEPAPRNFQIPGCEVHICSGGEGVTVEHLLAIVLNLVASNPDAIVDFGITVRGE